MHTRKLLLLLLTMIAALAVPAAASAAFEHVVAPGESLSSVAAADGLSVGQLAAANGISPDTQLTAGASLAIPPQTGEAAGTGETSSYDMSSTSGETPAESESGAAPAESAPASSGGYQVAPGDTLSAIAARYGTTVDQLAAANGLNPNGLLLAGTTISVGGGGGSSPSSSEPVSDTASTLGSAPASSSGTGAQPTDETVSPSYVGSVAAENGVSPSLAEAIANQESGFNNDEVSKTGATGVMQIEPGTWRNLNQVASPPLSPDSASDNVRGGVLLLHSLLDQTGGDPALAAAAYYQGLNSVRAHGMYSDTQQYVNDVMALSQRFGGQ
jgi:N-acetylmuramoyl-L-alanine amidase